MDDRSDLLVCLRETPPRIPTYFGYDALGSELFESITELPNYYLTRVEDALLQRHSAEIADLIGCGRIAELGSGSAKKTRLLLAACVERRATAYLPIDVRSAFTRFRLNHLTHLNRRFDADFSVEYFYPRAHYDPGTAAVESHLYATEDQSVALRQLDIELELQRGDSLSVGYSYKFHRPQFVADVTARGFELCAQWIDGVWQYGILLFVRSN
ncbi:MAG: L-histidine N(alpha)-methyltransferase [Actinomycetota bacterium]|nr:L-histidine N(alpha)-methyltransferase [Actinomycetota bacterium]